MSGAGRNEQKKDGYMSRMRNHAGNHPVLPQNKVCPYCPAKFTRTTHLNRHLRTHTNERLYKCNLCEAQFTRSDLLTRHKKSCLNSSGRPRRKACISCVTSKVKCDRESPCSKCKARGIPCVAGSPSSKRGRGPYDFSLPRPALANVQGIDFALLNSISASDNEAYGHSLTPSSLEEHLSLDRHRSKTDAQSDIYSSVDSDYITITDMDAPIGISTHISTGYSNDMFESFFSNVFSPELDFPSTSTTDTPIWGSLGLRANLVSQSPSEMLLDDRVGYATEDLENPNERELQHYMHCFFAIFLSQIPLVHTPTFSSKGKSPILVTAMQACGALFVRTQKASQFVTMTLNSARDALVKDFAKNSSDVSEQVELILAVVLLQTIGLFHQQADQRASSSIYHGMLVMMIRRTSLISKIASWTPGSHKELPLEILWMQWVINETAKRAILWSYMHDCCHCIYFALPPSYQSSELLLSLPCEDSLWNASTSSEWFVILQTPSHCGTPESRLKGTRMFEVVAKIEQNRLLTEAIPVSHFGHFVLIHSVLRRLFLACSKDHPLTASGGIEKEAVMDPEICLSQFALHNWLFNWNKGLQLSPLRREGDEPPFIENTLPFYWLGQVVLLAYQERTPPFECSIPKSSSPDLHFKLVKLWLKHIRNFLKANQQAPTFFWDELMKLRLQSWQIDLELGVSPEDRDGLLGFFPST
ncbi:fungal-specific transcription factor domain-containing protein [Cyathus striatus]|nr:fungal-specific transcription factor domain-containing protein [Cyathus striatus]